MMRELKIGRLPDNDIVVNDISVSRSHAVLQISGGDFYIQDLGSSNGTFVNGIRINGSTLLKRNDILKVGNALVPWMNYLNDSFNRNYVSPPQQPVQEVYTAGFGVKENLPNATAALVLGIIGVVFSPFFIGIVLNILALILGAGAVSRYHAEPGRFSEGSLSQATAGKVLGIVGLAIFGLALILVIAANS